MFKVHKSKFEWKGKRRHLTKLYKRPDIDKHPSIFLDTVGFLCVASKTINLGSLKTLIRKELGPIWHKTYFEIHKVELYKNDRDNSQYKSEFRKIA